MTDKSLALRICVSTLRGVREGVPALAAALAKHHACATFFFNFGPDPLGRALLRGHTFGFASRKHAIRTYGASGWFPGLLTPAPTVSDDAADVIRTTRDAGFEVGVHSWDYLAWVQQAKGETHTWIEDQMAYAHDAYQRVLGDAPRVISTPSWHSHRHQLRHAQQLGYAVSSVSRGTHPFRPVIAGEPIALVEIPTTLPTTGELLANTRATERTLPDALLAETAQRADSQVMTLFAEADGLGGVANVEALLAGWRAQGFTICAVGTFADQFDGHALPRTVLEFHTPAAKHNTITHQGKPYFS